MTIEDVNGKSNAGLTTGIIGTALSGLLTLGGGMLALNGGTTAASSNYVTKDELKMVQDLAAKDSQIALLTSENNTETKMIEVYKQAHAEVAALRDTVNLNYQNQQAWNTQQSVNNAQMAAAIAANVTSIGALKSVVDGITAIYVPAAQVTPEPMSKYNSWTAPTTTTTTTSAS